MNKVLILLSFGPLKRSGNLEKQLSYFKDQNYQPDLVITDQSIETWKSPPKSKFIKGVYHYPATKYSIYEMWEDVLKKHPHKYVCWNCDDDFINIDAIIKVENFIKENQTYSFICGQVIQLTNKKMELFNSYGYNAWLQKDIIFDSPQERALKAMGSNYYPNPHGFIKREVFLKACQIVNKSSKPNLGPIRFWDKILYLVCAMSGYVKTNLNVVSHIRLGENLSPRLLTENQIWNSKLEKDTPFSELYSRLTLNNPLKDFVIEKTGFNENEANNFFKIIFNQNNLKHNYIAKLYPFFPSRFREGKSFLMQIRKIVRLNK